MKTVMVLNGPNLNLLGVREPHIYGSTTLDAIRTSCQEFAAFAGATLSFHQSNHEGALVDLIQSARTDADAGGQFRRTPRNCAKKSCGHEPIGPPPCPGRRDTAPWWTSSFRCRHRGGNGRGV